MVPSRPGSRCEASCHGRCGARDVDRCQRRRLPDRVDVADGVFTADVMRETLRRSSLGALFVGSPAKLERAVRVSDRLGGHIVQGHVDGVGTVIEKRAGDQWQIVRISLPDGLSRYVVEKGSIALDGVSLTVSAVADGWFEVSLIPATLPDQAAAHGCEQFTLEWM